MPLNAGNRLDDCFGPTTYKPKAEIAYDEIRDAILFGRLKPGDRLAPAELSRILKVSHMPIREAIKRLELEGFVTVMPHKGVVVAGIVVEELMEMLSVRALLEGFAAREAAVSGSPADIAKLESLCGEMEKLTDGERNDVRMIKNREFHETICEMARNRFLKRIVSSICDSIHRYRIHLGVTQLVAEQHREIARAIAMKDAERAERIVRQHVLESLSEAYTGLHAEASRST